MRTTKHRGRIVLALVCVGVITAACGRETTPLTSGANAGTFPATITAANGEVAIPRRPQRIVSLSPTSTEMLFAIGAGEQVVAVDDQSNYPPEAPKTSLSGFQPNAEAVAREKPDLVVLSDDINEIVSSLAALKIPAIRHPAATTLQDSYTQMEQLGVATGHIPEAARLVASMRSEIDRLVRSAPKRTLSYYHELDQKLFSATSKTFIGQVYALVGLRNIADAAQGAATGYPQLSAEFIIKADPDVIFLADTKCCGQSAAKVAQRPGWSHISAVRTNSVVALDDDIASRWGPRIVELLKVVAREVSEIKAA